MQQGTGIGPDDMHCWSCGSIISRKAGTCIRCGVPVMAPPVSIPPTARPKRRGKSKTAAILLAGLFGFWTWLYTYKRDRAKFWVGLSVTLIGSIAEVASAPAGRSPFDFTRGGAQPDNPWLWIGAIASLAIWTWAVVDAVAKNQHWYETY